jgi:immune inhibitor A
MKIFCKLCFIVLALTMNVHAGHSQTGISAADNEAALHSVVYRPTDRYELAQRYLGVTAIPAPPSNPPVRRAGETEIFSIRNEDTLETSHVTAELRTVGETIYVWVEAGIPVSDQAAQEFADAFDEQIYHPVTRLWNMTPPPGIDGDPHIYALFATGIDEYTLAYFDSQNSYPAEVRPGSDEHEMLIFNVVNTSVQINDPYVYGIAAHELEHLLRSLIQPHTPNWLDEALATFTSDYIDFPINEDFLTAIQGSPDTALDKWTAGGRTGASYGTGLLFITYFHQRYGDEALQAISQMSNGGVAAIDGWLKQQGEPGFDTLFADFVLANRLLNAPAGYGYAGVWKDADLLPLDARATYRGVPLIDGSTLPQYAAHYYVLRNTGTGSIEIDLSIPDTVPLLTPGSRPADGAFWYAVPVDQANPLLTRAFDLTGVRSSSLHYRAWVDLEPFWDYAYVSISTDNGASWELLAPPGGTLENPFDSSYGSGYTGKLDWRDEVISLDAYAGKQIMIRFELITDEAILQPGFAIDNVSIPEIGYSETFETGTGGWEAAGWARITDEIPQRIFVQAVQHNGSELHLTRWVQIGSGTWTLPVEPGVEQITLAISPVTRFTFQPVAYTLRVAQKSR